MIGKALETLQKRAKTTVTVGSLGALGIGGLITFQYQEIGRQGQEIARLNLELQRQKDERIAELLKLNAARKSPETDLAIAACKLLDDAPQDIKDALELGQYNANQAAEVAE